MDALPADAGENCSEAVCYSQLSSADDLRCGPARSLSAKSCTGGDSDGSTVLSALACAAPFRIPLHLAGVFVLVHACRSGDLLDWSDVEATRGRGVQRGYEEKRRRMTMRSILNQA